MILWNTTSSKQKNSFVSSVLILLILINGEETHECSSRQWQRWLTCKVVHPKSFHLQGSVHAVTSNLHLITHTVHDVYVESALLSSCSCISLSLLAFCARAFDEQAWHGLQALWPIACIYQFDGIICCLHGANKLFVAAGICLRPACHI